MSMRSDLPVLCTTHACTPAWVRWPSVAPTPTPMLLGQAAGTPRRRTRCRRHRNGPTLLRQGRNACMPRASPEVRRFRGLPPAHLRRRHRPRQDRCHPIRLVRRRRRRRRALVRMPRPPRRAATSTTRPPWLPRWRSSASASGTASCRWVPTARATPAAGWPEPRTRAPAIRSGSSYRRQTPSMHVYAGNDVIHMQRHKDAKHTKYCYYGDHRLCDCCA
jgi:hypothetical protein